MYAFIPSPSSGVLHLGPISLHAYGLCIALGALAAVFVATKRWQAVGGTADDITAVATWSIPIGIVGARIYHVITDHELYTKEPIKALYVWDGGLGIWGGITAGVIAGLLVARSRRLDVAKLLDAVAPALPISQAVGRFGNWFNQELFGEPTRLPWGLEIDVAHRPNGFELAQTFHPTFLYESLWNLALAGALIVIGLRAQLKPGRLFALYVAGYTFGRFFIERLRIDYAHTIFGMRVNEWVSLVIFLGAVAFLLRDVIRTRASSSRTDVSEGR